MEEGWRRSHEHRETPASISRESPDDGVPASDTSTLTDWPPLGLLLETSQLHLANVALGGRARDTGAALQRQPLRTQLILSFGLQETEHQQSWDLHSLMMNNTQGQVGVP